MDPLEGEGWTTGQCEEAEREYRRFLTLLLLYPDRPIVPTAVMDIVTAITGASGAAVQNFNLMFGFPETMALL
jgi:hypothetical protein